MEKFDEAAFEAVLLKTDDMMAIQTYLDDAEGIDIVIDITYPLEEEEDITILVYATYDDRKFVYIDHTMVGSDVQLGDGETITGYLNSMYQAVCGMDLGTRELEDRLFDDLKHLVIN